MLRSFPAALAILLASAPAMADEFTDTVTSALESYAKGDINAAREDLDYASKLLTAMKSEALAKYLPAPLAGWTQQDASDSGEASGFMGMLGGGTTTSATYLKDGKQVTVTLLADSPMLSGMAAMISGIASMNGSKPMRIQRTEFSDNEGDLQGVVGGKVMVTVGGDAALEDKTAYIEAMDLDKLGAF